MWVRLFRNAFWSSRFDLKIRMTLKTFNLNLTALLTKYYLKVVLSNVTSKKDVKYILKCRTVCKER